MTALDPFLRLLFWGFFFLAAARIGAWLTGSRLRGLAHIAWDGLAGLPVLIAAFLAIGLARFDRPMVFATSAWILAIALARAYRDPVPRFADRTTERATKVALGCLVGLLVAGLAWNRVPVLFYDSLAYHFAQPDLWLLEGRIAPVEWSLHSWFPPGMSVLYGIGLALGGESWANDGNLLIGVALGLAGFDLARRIWNAWAGLVALIALLSVPQMLFALAVPAADLAHGTFVAAALGALLLAYLDSSGEWSRRAAWIAAGALLTKYLGLLVPLAAGSIFMLLHAERGLVSRSRVVAAVRFCVPPLLLLSPWLLANAAVVGNPVAPLVASWLPVDGLAPGGTVAFARDARGGLPRLADVQALGPRLFGPAESGIYPGPAWGWPVVAWFAVAAYGAWIDRHVRHVMAIAVMLFAIWFLTFRWERFLIATTFFACVAFAGTIALVAGRARVGRLLAVGAVILGVAYIPVSVATIARYSGAGSVLLAGEEPAAFVRRSFPQQRLVEHASLSWDPAADRVLLLGEMRHHRIPVPRVAPTGFNVHPFAVELERGVTAASVHRGLRARGFTHLLVDLDWIERSADHYPSLRSLRDEPEKLQAYLAALEPPLVRDGRRALYGIPEGP